MTKTTKKSAAEPTTVTETAKKPAEPTTVTMNDGRLVEFPPKRKVSKESFITANDDGSFAVQTRLDFRNGESRLVTLPAAMLAKFAAHGAEQKLGDAMSGLANVEDGILAVDDLIDQLYQGNWNTPRAASEMAGASILVRALVELKGQPVEKVKDFVKAKSAAERTALRNAPAVKAIIERLEAEKVAKAGNINADELLEGL